jgi:2-keto-4-pentenoate hydratase/2-oxohepta-3-ene-1,7-dioic acid hydratase in catechol pathway
MPVKSLTVVGPGFRARTEDTGSIVAQHHPGLRKPGGEVVLLVPTLCGAFGLAPSPRYYSLHWHGNGATLRKTFLAYSRYMEMPHLSQALPSMTWSKLIRFVDESGRTSYGDPCIDKSDDLISLLGRGELHAVKLTGNDPFVLARTQETVKVQKLLGVLKVEDIPIFKCIGYAILVVIPTVQSTDLSQASITRNIVGGRRLWIVQKAESVPVAETGRTPPPYPSLFMKPSTALAAFDDNIRVHTIAQGKNLDYEGELAVVIGKTGKNISQEEAISYVAGYASSNDVSARTWQRDPAYAGSIPQWSYAKSFDTFAPLGPMLVSPSVVGAADNLRLQTLVNGEMRQDSNTNDLVFNVAAIVSFLSQGSTLQKGTVIMTGTPDGVVLGMPDPKPWLQDGDIVEVKIEQLGSCINKGRFAATESIVTLTVTKACHRRRPDRALDPGGGSR